MNIKRFCEGAPLPVRKTGGAVGYDLVACLAEYECQPDRNGNILIPLGFGFEIPDGHVGIVAPRSSTSHWLLTGYVDPDYRGEVFAKTTSKLRLGEEWNRFDRIAQLIIVPVLTPELTVVDELSQTARGTGGHGSTGR